MPQEHSDAAHVDQGLHTEPTMSGPPTEPLPDPSETIAPPVEGLQAAFFRLGRAPLVLFGPFAGLVILCGAAPSSMDEAFNGTIVSTYPDGRTAELYLQRDGAYNALGRRGDPSNGHWKLGNGKLCLTQSRPLPVPFAVCTSVPADGLQVGWSAKAVTGEAIKVRLVKGHFVGKAAPPADDNAEKPQTVSRQN